MGQSSDPKAPKPGEAPAPSPGAPKDIRPAGPETMKDPPPDWDETDEEGDASFPASDPPGNY